MEEPEAWRAHGLHLTAPHVGAVPCVFSGHQHFLEILHTLFLVHVGAHGVCVVRHLRDAAVFGDQVLGNGLGPHNLVFVTELIADNVTAVNSDLVQAHDSRVVQHAGHQHVVLVRRRAAEHNVHLRMRREIHGGLFRVPRVGHVFHHGCHQLLLHRHVQHLAAGAGHAQPDTFVVEHLHMHLRHAHHPFILHEQLLLHKALVYTGVFEGADVRDA